MIRENYNWCMTHINRETFNCGGFALETFDWVLLYNYEEEISDDKAEYTERVTESLVEELLENYDIRRIFDLSELHENEYPIAFRVATDGWGFNDYHFAKRARNGQWYHKMGRCHFIQRMSEEEVLFGDKWCYRYNGPTVLFAKIYKDVDL